jgi:hypothetical protein
LPRFFLGKQFLYRSPLRLIDCGLQQNTTRLYERSLGTVYRHCLSKIAHRHARGRAHTIVVLVAARGALDVLGRIFKIGPVEQSGTVVPLIDVYILPAFPPREAHMDQLIEEFVHQQNIGRLRTLLAETKDEPQLQLLFEGIGRGTVGTVLIDCAEFWIVRSDDRGHADEASLAVPSWHPLHRGR